MKLIAKVNILAANIRRIVPGTSRSVSMKQAWETLRSNPDAELLVFKKKNDKTETIQRRVVVKLGAGKAPNQLLFRDLSKVAAGFDNAFISTFPELIIPLAA